MSFWVCAVESDCKACFNSCNKLKGHQRRVHDCKSSLYRYVHCSIHAKNQETISVRILDGGECISAFQLRNNSSQKDIIERVHKKSMSYKTKNKTNHQDERVWKCLVQIKDLVKELETIL